MSPVINDEDVKILSTISAFGVQRGQVSSTTIFVKRKRASPTSPWGQWQPISPTNNPSSSPEELATSPPVKLKLYAIRHVQSEGEPCHWMLFTIREDGRPGTSYEVKGDSAVQMTFFRTSDVDMLNSEVFHDHLIVNDDLSVEQESELEIAVAKEPPPSAENMWGATENCQGWTIRVLERLEKKRVVMMDDVEVMRGKLEPVRR